MLRSPAAEEYGGTISLDAFLRELLTHGGTFADSYRILAMFRGIQTTGDVALRVDGMTMMAEIPRDLWLRSNPALPTDIKTKYGDVEQNRLLGARAAPICLDGRFTPAVPLLAPFRGALTVLGLGESTDRSECLQAHPHQGRRADRLVLIWLLCHQLMRTGM